MHTRTCVTVRSCACAFEVIRGNDTHTYMCDCKVMRMCLVRASVCKCVCGVGGGGGGIRCVVHAPCCTMCCAYVCASLSVDGMRDRQFASCRCSN